MSSSTGCASASRRAPASVSATLRVLRLRRRTPSRSSKERMVWLSVGAEIPSCAAAFLKFRCSATATKALSSANWVPRILTSCQKSDRVIRESLRFQSYLRQPPTQQATAALTYVYMRAYRYVGELVQGWGGPARFRCSGLGEAQDR